MLLSNFFKECEVYRDNEFKDLGYANHNGDKILTFCDNTHYFNLALKNTQISSIITTEDVFQQNNPCYKGIVVSDTPRQAFFNLYNNMRNNKLFVNDDTYGVSSTASIASTALVSKKSYIGANTIVSDYVVIKDNVYIGENCFIDTGVIIGNEGILYTLDNNDNNIFIKHAGKVVIENNVTLLSNAVIVKSVFPNMPTRIGHHSIIGIATTIGHEAKISPNCKILGNCVIAKNVNIGADTLVGSSSVIRENLSIGKNVDIKAGSIVVKNIADTQTVSGNFAIKHNLNVKNYFKNMKD